MDPETNAVHGRSGLTGGTAGRLRPPVLALAAFFLSGFAALLYQVVWQRLLVLFSGADVYSVTIIVAAFMVGLGIGNLAGGYVADRLTTTANLLLFAVCEIAIAIFGAASKTIATTWWLLPRVGLEAALTAGATINVLCAAAAVLLVPEARRSAASTPVPDATATRDVPPVGGPRVAFPVWAFLYGVTGFTALALEMVWFRMLGVTLKSTAFTFGTLLCVYLAALGLGSAVASTRVALSRAPGSVFVALQFGAIAITGLSAVTLLIVIDLGWVAFLSAHVEERNP